MTSLYDPVTFALVNTDDLPATYGYDGNGNIITETVTTGHSTWVKTYTYTNNVFSGVSAWVKQ